MLIKIFIPFKDQQSHSMLEENSINQKFTYIILDANFILLPIQFRIDIYDKIPTLIEGKFKFIIFSEVIAELERKRKREKRNKFRLQLNGSKRLLDQKIENNPEKFVSVFRERLNHKLVDDMIVDYGKELKKKGIKVLIASNDQGVRRKSEKNDIQTIYMRQEKFLILS